jgi:anti-sigma28 factor (negative regulator of flagellin synthesis)
MAIDSLGRSGAPQPDPRRTDAAEKGAPVTPSPLAAERPRAAPVAADTVELSAEAIALASQQVPSQTIEPIRLREITRKIADGQYEAPPTLEMLTNRLMKELRGEQ